MQFDNEKNRLVGNSSDPEVSYLQSVAESTVAGWVNYASWLSDDILLMVGWFHAEDWRCIKVSLILDDRPISLEARCMSYPRPDLPDTDPCAGKIVTARFLRPDEARKPLGNLMIHADNTTFALGPLELSQAMTDLQALVHGGLAWLDPARRDEVMAFVVSTLEEHRGTTNSLLLSKNLFLIRGTLRERLPSVKIERNQPEGMHVDNIMTLDERSFYVRGWARAQEGEITHLTAVSPEGARIELLDKVFRYPRADIVQFYGAPSIHQPLVKDGFSAFFEVEAPSRLSSGWIFEMGTTAGRDVETVAPPLIRDSLTARNIILADLVYDRLPSENLMLNHVFPAVSRLQERSQATVEVESVVQYGTLNEAPDVSIIVPLYQRIDFLEQQLAQFVHDPEIFQAELIYMLDSPELTDALRDAAAQLFPLYRIPFKIVTLKQNAGFSAVNNVGASLARGRLLLLLNSDVLPEKPGWLGRMIEFYDSTPGIGALGPKLLFEDDSLQHAGVYFSPLADTSLWENMHYFKGLHRHLPVANVPRPVPAVTGACLMIDSDLYERFGGLRSIYVQGDYEDSDLCLQLVEAGYENWYLPDAELYHLEGQSQSVSSRQLHNRYNIWLHTRLWRERIGEVMDRYASPTAGLVAVGGNERRGSSAPASKRASERRYAQRSAASKDAVAKKRGGAAAKASPTESRKRGTSRGRKEKGRKRNDGSLGTS
jgi:GT2 family glycosyltransferase